MDGVIVVDKPRDWTSHDVVARGLTPAMNEFLGQPLITENMPAAAGIAAMAALTRATPA